MFFTFPEAPPNCGMLEKKYTPPPPSLSTTFTFQPSLWQHGTLVDLLTGEIYLPVQILDLRRQAQLEQVEAEEEKQ